MTLDAIRKRLAGRRDQLHALSVAVICGGGGAEREVSLTSGANVAQALLRAGFAVNLLPIARDWLSIDSLASAELTAAAPALAALANNVDKLAVADESASAIAPLRDSGVVFTTMHGLRGEDGVWQGLLELIGVPYVSAAVKGSALAFDKLSSKRIFERLGVATPAYCVLRRGDDPLAVIPAAFSQIVAKPVEQGSSVDVLMVENDSAGHEAIRELLAQYGKILVEQRIHGSELTCGVIGHNEEALALPLVQIVPQSEFYTYKAKYTAGGSEYICPAPIAPEVGATIQQQSSMLYRELELEPYARFDCILDNAGTPWFLEVNTLPGFTEFSLLPKAARQAGIEFVELIEILMLCALERQEAKD